MPQNILICPDYVLGKSPIHYTVNLQINALRNVAGGGAPPAQQQDTGDAGTDEGGAGGGGAKRFDGWREPWKHPCGRREDAGHDAATDAPAKALGPPSSGRGSRSAQTAAFEKTPSKDLGEEAMGARFPDADLRHANASGDHSVDAAETAAKPGDADKKRLAEFFAARDFVLEGKPVATLSGREFQLWRLCGIPRLVIDLLSSISKRHREKLSLYRIFFCREF